jgi:hypothetical protein
MIMLHPAHQTVLAILLCAHASVTSAQVTVPNNSFEEGAETPASWTLTGGQGKVVSPGANGQRAISVTGDGRSDNAWLSEPLPLEPRAVYRLRFQARRLRGTAGLPVSGPVFCNRDLTALGNEWTTIESLFMTPRQLSEDITRLRFGQWQVDGTVAFDDVRLERAIPVYASNGELQLGEGERLEGNRYTFDAPFQQAPANHARTLAWHQCSFNSNRWTLSESSVVTYRHHVGRAQRNVKVQATIGWHLRGELVVSASRDGEQWETVGTLGKTGSVSCEVPAALLPADDIWVRFTVRAATGDAQAPALQLHGYQYEAAVDGPPRELVGATRYVAVLQTDPRLQVSVADLGEAIPGGNNVVTLRLRGTADKTLKLAAEVSMETGGRQAAGGGRQEVLVGNAEQTVQIPYTIDRVGPHALGIQISGDARFAAETTVDVPSLHAAHYGQVLPASNAAVGLWWCSSGWKISSQRPVPPPEAQSAAMRIAAAANEAEAAQLVVRPTRALSGLTVAAGELTGPAGAKIDAQQIDILRVRYVPVTQPTDASSTVGLWPDPLPPWAGPVTVEANRNLPLWVRVRVPRNQGAGIYRGMITLQADNYRAEVPLHVEVFGFTLPDRMTCQTAFGFDVSEVWRYHAVKTDEHRRLVLDKYFQCLADHHISPYDPAPLDPIDITWKNIPASSGGDRGEQPTPEPVFDFTAWDRAMRRAIDVYHFNTFRLNVPGLGGGTFHERYEPELLGYSERTPQYEGAMRAYLETLQAHLREQGWLDEAFVYWFDEPDPKDYAFVNNGFSKLKKWAPDIRRMLTEQVEEALVGGPNIWCPLTASYDDKVATERRDEGDAFWWYVCTGPKTPYCTLFIDHPGTELRVWLWQTWQRRITGVLVWQTNYWTSSAAYPDPARPQNPYADPMGWMSGYSTPPGARQAWGNGDGRFLYPPESSADGRATAPVLEDAVASIRLEMLRDGIEDYEYLAILRRLLEARRAAWTAGQLAEYTSLLEVPAAITSDITTFTRDPAPIEQRREEIARAIERLSQ